MKIRIVVELEVELREGDTVADMQARWVNNRTTHRLLNEVEQAALIHVVDSKVRLA